MGTGLYGIDFGTTSSAVVELVADDRGRTTLTNHGDLRDRPIPSDVAIDRTDGTIYRGREAKDKRNQLKENCEYIASIKMHIGKGWKQNIAGKVWTDVDVAAQVFSELKANTQDDMKAAVVAVPIGCSAQARKSIRQAADMAGIDITSFVSEPTAAFFANYNKLKHCNNVVIFDWGGGTLDVSVIRHQDGKIEELATKGLAMAGNDIDDKLARRIHAKICKKHNMDMAYEQIPPVDKDKLINKAEDIKINFSSTDADVLPIRMTSYCNLGAIRETITYDWFKEIILPDVEHAVKIMRDTIVDAGLNDTNIDMVLLTGGSSGLAPLYDVLIENYDDDKLFWTETNMWDVGRGAAMLSQNTGSYHSSQKIALRLSDGGEFNLLKPGDPVDARVRKAAFALTDQTEEARLAFFGSEDLRDNTKFTVPAYGFLDERIILTYGVTQDLVLRLEAYSDRKGRDKDSLGTWEYDRLKLYYVLPEKQA